MAKKNELRQKKWSNKIQIEFRWIKNKKKKIKRAKKHSMYIEMLYKARNEDIKFYDDHSLMPSWVKAGNNSSESLLNEVRQIVHLLYQSKGITKKVYNNII